MPVLYLIDGSSYIHRAYHAIRGLANSKGLPTNAVLGFIKMLLKLKKEKKPEYWALCFDVKGKTFRHDMYEKYKANRPPMPEDLSVQIPYIKKISKAFSIPVIEQQGFEADDIIGSLKTLAEKKGFLVIMVTGDKDFIQLVTEKSMIWDPMKEKIIDIDAVQKEYGIEPFKMIEVMGLSGDSSDNIPGIFGIGIKTALSLIKEYGSIENTYNNIDKISKKKLKENLIKYKDNAFLSKKLVTINTNMFTDLDIKELKCQKEDPDKLSDILKELEFFQIRKEFFENKEPVKKDYHTILTEIDLENLYEKLNNVSVLAIDTETTSKSPIKAKLVGISLSFKPNEAYYIPIAHNYISALKQLDFQKVIKILKPIFENSKIKKIGQNIKYDFIVLLRHGIELKGIFFDTMIASYLINPSKRAHNLEQIAIDFLDYKKNLSFKDVAGKKAGACFEKVDIETASIYSCEDADITYLAYEKLIEIIKENELYELFQKIEMPLIKVLSDMELKGICVDREKLRELSASFENRLKKLEKNIYETAGEEFNINSSIQLGEILFEKLNLPIQKKTKKTKNYSTDVDVLKTLSSMHELPALVLEQRTLSKLKSTYTDALAKLINPETKRIHTSFNQSVTATGRLSSSSPNLQNIPIRTEDGKNIRKAFVPQKGFKLISADYSQIELRILAHYSEDEILIKAFQDDEDIHLRTAVEVFNTFPELITKELRRYAKTINFGIIYGMSAYGLSKELMISQKMAKTYIENYFIRYKGVKEFIEKTIEKAKEAQKTSTLFGRIRYLPDINSKNANLRGFAQRTAVNTPIQGTAADIIKLAMLGIHSKIKAYNLKSTMLLSIHDELIFEVHETEIETFPDMVKEVMENVCTLKVALKVNIKEGM
jgi:DNA polymerase I